jgi:hypothetical protein
MRPARLTAAQRAYLEGASYLPTDLRDIVAAELAVTPPAGGMTLEIDLEVAERFRSVLTERLAQVGFDPTYELTDEGAALEELIEVFFSGTK